jgi:hypothetical protein
MALAPHHDQDLRYAVAVLEKTSFMVRLSHRTGQPVEKLIARLPEGMSRRLQRVVQASVSRLLDLSIKTMRQQHPPKASLRLHKVAGGVSGAIGGAFGLSALAAELPLSTAIILRSIADIARSEGEDMGTVESRLACLAVFALGGRRDADGGADTGYYAVRATLTKALGEAARHIASRGLAEKGAPVMVRFIAKIASRLGPLVTEKVAAQAVPMIGALGGAAINLLFMNHFQETARGHFIVRRLERIYGKEVVQRAYRDLNREAQRR